MLDLIFSLIKSFKIVINITIGNIVIVSSRITTGEKRRFGLGLLFVLIAVFFVLSNQDLFLVISNLIRTGKMI